MNKNKLYNYEEELQLCKGKVLFGVLLVFVVFYDIKIFIGDEKKKGVDSYLQIDRQIFIYV